MSLIEVHVPAGKTLLSARYFSVSETLSSYFRISVMVMSEQQDIDPDTIVGQQASLVIAAGNEGSDKRTWVGLCNRFVQTQAEPDGLSSYSIEIVHSLYLTTQRTNHRIFQHQSIPDIVKAILGEWKIDATWQLSSTYPPLEYKVQYGESDYHFILRLLEEAGIAFYCAADGASTLTFGDALGSGETFPRSPIAYADNPSRIPDTDVVSSLHLEQDVRPGAFAVRDHDFRQPSLRLLGMAPTKATAPENKCEQHVYRPGSFLIEVDGYGDTPVADDKGIARHVQPHGTDQARLSLEAVRTGKRRMRFHCNVVDFAPGTLFMVENHPHPAMGELLLITDCNVSGAVNGDWTVSGGAVRAAEPYRPARVTPKPNVQGVQTATVVGPSGEEIYVDEFGRVRVQFPWDREGEYNDNSSVWMRVSQGWAGTGFGFIQLPRIGQEVLVSFLAGDPDRPIVVGRVFNAQSQVPYKLPDHKTRSTWKSYSSIGGDGTNFNEILFEDLKNKELVYMQAEKNQRRLVKNDEVITIGNNRQKLVKVNEIETTKGNRIQVTEINRTELTDGNRVTVIRGHAEKLIKGNEFVSTKGNLQLAVAGNADIVTVQNKKEQVKGASHLTIGSDYNQSITGGLSISVGTDEQHKVGTKMAVDAGQEIHLKAGMNLVVESGLDLTLKGAGGFIRIDATGVTIQGTLVKINSGGAPGSGGGSSPTAAQAPKQAVVKAPEKPVMDDVSENGLAQ